MHKLAIFVEGHSELLFVRRLLQELAGRNNVAIHSQQIVGGKSIPRKSIIIDAAQVAGNERFYILISDCGGDHQVASRIKEEHATLSASGYTKIIGVRDVRPDFSILDIPRLERGLKFGVRTDLISVDFILSVMEIEAWFLSEATHFSRIHPSLTVESIKHSLGFDPQLDDMSGRTAPAKDLNDCYQLAGFTYRKGSAATCDALDYAECYLTLPTRIPHLRRLVDSLDTFLGLASQS